MQYYAKYKFGDFHGANLLDYHALIMVDIWTGLGSVPVYKGTLGLGSVPVYKGTLVQALIANSSQDTFIYVKEVLA